MKDALGHGSDSRGGPAAHQSGVGRVANGPHQIVYARAEKTALVPTGRTVTRDRNQFPEFKADWAGRAGMWLRKGTDDDAEKARKALEAEGYTIHKFPQTERDALGKARAHVVEKARQSERG